MAALALTIVGGRLAGAQTVITVCPTECDFDSIQGAIDDAVGGDTIDVLSGSYPGWETSKELTFNGNNATTITSGIKLNGNQTLNGFSVTASSGPGIHVSLDDGESVTISDTTSSNNPGNGIHSSGIASGATLTLTNVTATSNGGASCLRAPRSARPLLRATASASTPAATASSSANSTACSR